MTDRTKPLGNSALRRWSRLKHEAAREKEKPSAPPPAEAAVPVTTATSVVREEPATPQAAGALPPVEALTIDSDFSGFLHPTVDDALKRRALKQLFRDPHFNVMDGLDVYVGDYSQPDPISPDIVREMVQGRYIFNPPATRINEQGFVEDVPVDELAALESEQQPPALDAAAQPHAEGAAAHSLEPPSEDAQAAAIPAPEPRVETPSIEVPDATEPPAR